ncbi:MAG: S1C family serine protease [Acidimicrobiales bacterium]
MQTSPADHERLDGPGPDLSAPEPDAPPYWLTEAPPTSPIAVTPAPTTEPMPAPVDRSGRSGRSRARGGAALVAVALLAGATGSVVTLALDDQPPASPATTAAGAPVRSVELTGQRLDVAGVVAKAEPSVVSIRAGNGAGTGVILSADGEILTNAHVVEGSSSVRVTLAGESQARTADVVGSDPAADLALLRIPGASGLAAAELGKSASVAVGDDVVAIGNALALRGGPTVTRGIVSALDRSLDTMTGLIQTDASISSGNSGGPLVNATGQVIGINSAVASSGRGTAAENIGFAIAVDQAIPVVDRLRGGGGPAVTGLLGVRSEDPEDGSRGATIVSVEPGSPAADAGLQAGDLVTAVDAKTVDGAATLAAAVRSHQPGDRVALAYVRDGDSRRTQATLGTGSAG